MFPHQHLGARRGAPETLGSPGRPPLHRRAPVRGARRSRTRSLPCITHGSLRAWGAAPEGAQPGSVLRGVQRSGAHVGAFRPRRPRDTVCDSSQSLTRVCGRPTRREDPSPSVRKDRPTSSRRSGASWGGSHRTAPQDLHATCPWALSRRGDPVRGHTRCPSFGAAVRAYETRGHERCAALPVVVSCTPGSVLVAESRLRFRDTHNP